MEPSLGPFCNAMKNNEAYMDLKIGENSPKQGLDKQGEYLENRMPGYGAG